MPDTPALDPAHLITDEATLRAAFPPTHDIAVAKCLDHIDGHARAFIARSPFLCIGSQSADGTADISPRGDPPGFVKCLDARTLLIPDRPGNNRLDTLSNIISNPSVGLMFVVPGFDETMRVNGTAQITRDPALLAQSAVQDRVPTVGIVVTVAEVFIHCAKAFRRSKLWDPSRHQDRKGMPSLLNIVLDQIGKAPTDAASVKALDDEIEEAYRTTMY